jgi:hypothetical protein
MVRSKLNAAGPSMRAIVMPGRPHGLMVTIVATRSPHDVGTGVIIGCAASTANVCMLAWCPRQRSCRSSELFQQLRRRFQIRGRKSLSKLLIDFKKQMSGRVPSRGRITCAPP